MDIINKVKYPLTPPTCRDGIANRYNLLYIAVASVVNTKPKSIYKGPSEREQKRIEATDRPSEVYTSKS